MINLVKYMKGCTSIRELEELPNSYTHTIYKNYVDMVTSQKDEDADAQAEEEVMEEITESMGG